MPFRAIPISNDKYKVINTDTGRIHAYHSTLENAHRQIRLLNSLTKGDGFLHTILHGRDYLPPDVEKCLKKYGSEKIINIKIGRKPLNQLFLKVANYLSDIPYDKLFHLFLIIKTTNNLFQLEKEETVKLFKINVSPQNAEYLDIKTIPPNISLNELIQKTKDSMGIQKMVNYSAYNNNCQHFLLNVLLSNNITNNEYLEFIKQDTEQIFKQNPLFRKFLNTITDVGNRANIIYQGKGLEKNDKCNCYNNIPCSKCLLIRKFNNKSIYRVYNSRTGQTLRLFGKRIEAIKFINSFE
jgi:hypothetical protein